VANADDLDRKKTIEVKIEEDANIGGEDTLLPPLYSNLNIKEKAPAPSSSSRTDLNPNVEEGGKYFF
jgi:hypothetical protein